MLLTKIVRGLFQRSGAMRMSSGAGATFPVHTRPGIGLPRGAGVIWCVRIAIEAGAGNLHRIAVRAAGRGSAAADDRVPGALGPSDGRVACLVGLLPFSDGW